MKLRAFAFAALALASVASVGIPAAQGQVPELIAPPPPTDEAREQNKASEGTPSLIEFQGDPVDLVLRTLARRAKVNLVLSDQVADKGGTVTMRIEDKMPMDAIEIIVQSKSFVMDELDGVYFVKTAEEIGREPIDRRLERLRETIVGPLAQFKGEYYRKLVEAGVPVSTASDLVLREEVTAQVIEPQLRKGTSPQERKAASSSSDDGEGLLRRLGMEGIEGWLAFGAFGVALLGSVPTFVLHVALAIAVWVSARRVKKAGEPLSFFPPFIWACATLVGGLLAAVFFWVVHHSNLAAHRKV